MNSFPDIFGSDDAGMRGSSRLLRLTRYYRFLHPTRGTITVPTGFITDGASIPQLFWAILGPHGTYFPAAVIHDYLYNKASDGSFGDLTRAEADQIFLDAMESIGVSWLTRHTIYYAVRLFGWTSYKKRRY